MQDPYSLATADETRTTDGYVYNGSVREVPEGFQARLVWISMPAERSEHLEETMTTVTLHSARAAIVEAHALALERIHAWREF